MVYGSNGVCLVEAVVPVGKEGRLHYVLSPLRQSCTITTPVDNPKVFMRPLISGETARALLKQSGEAEPFYARRPRELTEHYDRLLKTFDTATVLFLYRSIRRKEQELSLEKKRLGTVDESYLRRAEDLLLGELSVALGKHPEELGELLYP